MRELPTTSSTEPNTDANTAGFFIKGKFFDCQSERRCFTSHGQLFRHNYEIFKKLVFKIDKIIFAKSEKREEKEKSRNKFIRSSSAARENLGKFLFVFVFFSGYLFTYDPLAKAYLFLFFCLDIDGSNGQSFFFCFQLRLNLRRKNRFA